MRNLISSLSAFAVVITSFCAGTMADVVINEIRMVPDDGPCPCAMAGCEPIRPLVEYVELLNRGPGSADLGNWWICDQPTNQTYLRLRQIPQGSGMPFSPAIVLGEGDFLVIKFGCLVPFPGYSTRANGSATTTHITTLPFTVTANLQMAQTNFSIWNHSPPSNPDFPSFDQPQFLRDFVAWSQTGVYVGAKRGCMAANPVAALWPAEFAGDCQTQTPPPEFIAVNSSPLFTELGSSINYSGRFANDPSDYFVAPATEGERNAMPGDLDDDFDMDYDDSTIFESCLTALLVRSGSIDSGVGLGLSCVRADLDMNNVVDCEDWPLFVELWLRYSVLPPPEPTPCPECMPGDLNKDKIIDGSDYQGFTDVLLGYDNSPEGRCASDINSDGLVDCLDVTPFAQLTLGVTGGGCLIGDVNVDGVVDGLDIQPFINSFGAILCGTTRPFCAADANSDQMIDFDDVDGFVQALLP